MTKHFITIGDIDFRSEVKKIDSSPRHYPRDVLLPGLYKKVALLFYEPSTRTSSSFWAAAQDLNFSVLPINQVQYSSVAKGETLEDTIRTIGSYVDGIVLRHPERGAAAAAAEVSPVPIINAGDGDGEHPTQTMLDLYTIYKEFGTLEDLIITVMGDLKYGRTIHSLVQALGSTNKFHCISPEGFELPEEYRHRTRWQSHMHSNDPKDAEYSLGLSDVLYVVRTQRERFDKRDYLKMKDNCVVTESVADMLNDKAIVMHPFPRTHELPTWFDSDPRARYFQQMENGLKVRKHILKEIIL